MPCCYEDGKGWCKDFQTVYTDEQGKNYCVFHAPQGRKGISLEAFNDLVCRRIREAQKTGRGCNLSGTILDGDISFEHFNVENPLPAINFSGVTFSGVTDFKYATFGGDALFVNATFSGNTDFKYATFSGDAFFMNAAFGGKVDFMIVTFSGDAFFRNATFTDETIFARNKFKGSANFLEVVCSGDAFFGNATFSEIANFERATFSGNAFFGNTTFNGIANFERATFSGNASFANSYIGEDGKLYFTGNALKKHHIFEGQASFEALNLLGILKFEGVNLSKARFSDTDVRKVDFLNVNWREKGGRRFFDEIALFREIGADSENNEGEHERTTLYADYLDFKHWLKSRFFYAEEYGDRIRKVGILYRRMKQKYKELHNEQEVSNWHYGEKEMFRKETPFRRYFPLSFSFLYWLSSGYGERYVRAGLMLLALIVTASFGLAWAGLDAAPRPGSNTGGFFGIHTITLENLNVKSVCALLTNILKYVTFQKDFFFVPHNITGEAIKMMAQILIPLQTVLFALAVRNRFRR